MLKFLLVINQNGILRLSREYNHRFEDPFFLDNVLIYSIYQELISFKNKGKFVLDMRLNHSTNTKIYFKQYANLFFVIGGDEEVTNLILIQDLVERIDAEFQMKSCELDFIYSYDRINKIVDEMMIF